MTSADFARTAGRRKRLALLRMNMAEVRRPSPFAGTTLIRFERLSQRDCSELAPARPTLSQMLRRHELHELVVAQWLTARKAVSIRSHRLKKHQESEDQTATLSTGLLSLTLRMHCVSVGVSVTPSSTLPGIAATPPQQDVQAPPV